MSLVQDEPDALVLEAEALIREARRRQMQRRWAIVAVLFVVAVVMAGALITGWPGRTTPKGIVPSSSEPGRGSPTGQFSASTSSINFIGSWSVSSLVFPTREEGFAFVDGSLRNTMSALMERTTDGGRTWLAMREQTSISNAAPTNLAFNSASDGWWYGFTVLRRTTDSGRSWQEVPTTGDVISLVTSGPRTWMVASVGPIPRNGRCHSEVLSSNGPKELPTPLKRQPQLGTSCNWQLLSVSLSTVYLSESSQGAAPSYYWATTDFGQAWVKRATPCNDARRFGSFDLTGAKNALWLLCPTGPVDNMPALQPMRLYVSSNNGNSWQLTWKGWFQLGEVVVTSSRQAWLWSQWRGALPGDVDRTTDAGLKWSDVFPYWSKDSIQTPFFGRADFVLPQSLVANGDGAALAVDTVHALAPGNLNHLIVGTTNPSGKTWRWSYLRNLPLPKRTAKPSAAKK